MVLWFLDPFGSYSVAGDPPSGFASEATVGYLHTSGGSGLVALYRHYNAATGDYLLTTASSPPSSYVLQATLGYLHTNSGTTGVYQDLAYSYDNGGNITTITDGLWTGSREFAYDDLNRLTQATGNFGPGLAEVTHNYAYDAIGNILQKAGVDYYYCNHPQQPAPSQYCGGAIHPSAVVSTSDGKVYTYDANGNTTGGAGRTLTWNADNRVESVSAPGGSADMVYDYTGTRVKKSGSSATTYFPFAGYEVTGSIVTKYIRVGNETLAAKKGGDKLFYHNDHLGGINVITNIFAVLVQLDEYDPWGSVSRSEGNVEETKRFTGKELDPESGLYYYGGRYYDAQLARFVSPDPFVPQPGNPQSFNRYSYTINNPQIYIDPSGHWFWELLSALTSKNKSASVFVHDPISFILSKLPRKVNAGIQIFGGVVMMITGNPAGALVVASGGLSFAKGNGFQIASQVLGIAGTIAGLYHSYGPGTPWSSESGQSGTNSLAGQQFAEASGGVSLSDAGGKGEMSWSEYMEFRPPDNDGYLTLGEAKWQWQNAKGAPVTVDTNKLDFSGLNVNEFPKGVGSTRPFEFPKWRDFMVHGTVTTELNPNNTVSARIDTFNFDLKPWSGHFLRNVYTLGLRAYMGPGTPFPVHFRGTVPIAP